MKRRTIPALGMSPYGQTTLRNEGFVAMPLEQSLLNDPARFSPHYHEFFQVSLLTGPGRLMHDFRETDTDGTTLFFLSPGQVHTISPSGSMRGTIISFTREFFDGQADASPTFLTELPFFFLPDTMPWLLLQQEGAHIAKELFAQLQTEFDQALPGASDVLRAVLRILFVWASRWHTTNHPTRPSNRATHLVRSFHLLIDKHFLTWHTLEPFARELRVTVNHLNDVVSDETGQSAGDHLRLRRVLDAKRLLLYSDLSISEVAYRVGFKDPSYFGRFFRRYEHLTPAAFRQQIREKYQDNGE